MMNNDRQRPVSLEDLLRLKRAERPPVEFWAQFDRELRAKQLSALVKKSPWWRTAVPRAFASLARYHLPIGATAVLAVTFLTVRDYRPAAHAPVLVEVGSTAASPVSSESIVGAEPQASATVGGVIVLADTRDAGAAYPMDQMDAAVLDSTESSGSMAKTFNAAARSEFSDEVISPTARTIKANLQAAHEAHPELARKFLGQSRGYEVRAASARSQVVEPLSQMTLPSDVRRSRLLASALPVSSNAPARTSERVSSRLSQDRLYDSISRYGVGGNTVSIKF